MEAYARTNGRQGRTGRAASREPFTVGDVLRMDGLERARVVGGAGGLGREVLWITVGEEPDLPEWVFGGELILSTLFAIEPGRRGDYVAGLSDRGVAGLFVKPQRFIGETPSEVLEVADRESFPVVEVPPDVLWSRLLAGFYQRLLAEQVERVRIETEMRLRGGFLDELLSDQLGEGEILRRAAFLGCDLSRGGTVLIFDVKDFAGIIRERSLDEARVQRLKDVFYEAVVGAATETHPNSLCVPRSDSVFVMLGGSEGAEGQEALARRVLARCSGRLPTLPVHVGIGEHREEATGILLSCREADSALRVGQRLKDSEDKIHHFGSLGVQRLLSWVHQERPEALKGFERDTLEPLVRYDERHGTHLVETLATYMECDGNLSAVAERLYAHRHTIRYRLRRVQEISGLDVGKLDDVVRLYLALKISRFV